MDSKDKLIVQLQDALQEVRNWGIELGDVSQQKDYRAVIQKVDTALYDCKQHLAREGCHQQS